MTKNTGQPSCHKSFPVTITAVDEAQGIVEAIVSVMGNIDWGDDIIHPGAFVKTLVERGRRVRVLDNHNNRSVLNVIGKPLEIREIGRDELPDKIRSEYPEAQAGLYTKTQYLLSTPEGRGVFERIKSGAVDEYSIGFDALDVDLSKVTDPKTGKEKVVRNIRTIKLYEYSPVVFAMNEAGTTVSVKTVSGAAGLPLADRAREWDASAAEGRVRNWAGGADDMDWAKYRKAFFWYDGDNGENFTAYKLGFADVIGGELQAVPRGLFAVAAVLQGSRGGADIPASDQNAIKGKVATYYAAMRREFDDDTITVPWAESSASKEMTPDGPVTRLGDVLMGAVLGEAGEKLTDWLKDGVIDNTEHAALAALVTRHIGMIRDEMPDDVALRDVAPMPLMLWNADHAGTGADDVTVTEEKADNGQLQQAVTLLQQALDLLNTGTGVTTTPAPDMSAGTDTPPANQDNEDNGPQASEDAPTPADDQPSEAGPHGDEPAPDLSELLDHIRQSQSELEAINT